MPGRLTLATPPAVEPVSRDDARLHCRIDADFYDDDPLIDALITAARQFVEETTGRSLITQTWRLVLSGFPNASGAYGPYGAYRVDPLAVPAALAPGQTVLRYAIRLPRGPVSAVTSVQYRDATGALVTLDPAAYLLSADSWDATLTPAPGQAWPAAQQRPDAVAVTYQAGYGAAAAAVPAPITAAIKLLVAQWYEQREAAPLGASVAGASPAPFAVDALLSPYRVLEAV